MAKVSSDVVIREAETTDDDRNYTRGTMLKSFRHRGRNALDTDSESYFESHHQVLENILERGARLSLAVPRDDPNHILGYALWEPRVLHYVFTRETHRQMGIGSLLLQSIQPWPDFYSHQTTEFEEYLKGKRPHMRWAPYLVVWKYDGQKRDEERAKAALRSRVRVTTSPRISAVNRTNGVVK